MPHRSIAIIALILSSGSLPLAAQWPDYASHSVPRTPDGKPNLSGPAPKTADGKPDLSGIWQYQRPPEPPGQAAPPPPPTPPQATSPNNDIVPLAVRRSQFWNLGASFKD